MDSIAMDTHALTMSVTGAAADVVTQQDPALRRARAPVTLRNERFSGPRWSDKRRRKMPRCARLRTSIRRAIIAFIAHLSPAQIAPESRLRRPARDHHRRPPDCPSSPRRSP